MSRRRLLSMGLGAASSVAVSACAGTGERAQADDGLSVTVWAPREDQTVSEGRWLQTQCEAFAAAHPEWRIEFRYGVCSDGYAFDSIVTDPAAAADVYLFSNGQIPGLVGCIGVAELGGTWVDEIRRSNSETTVSTVTYEGGVYGFPFTSNTWFMYYDRSVFDEDDILSLDAMLEKGEVAFPLDTSWYIAAFYVANGCTLFGPDGTDGEAGIDFGGQRGRAVTDYLVDLVANPRFSNGDVNTSSGAKAFFSGSWDYQKALNAYGDRLGVAPPPQVTIEGRLCQLRAFSGTKCVGCNPSTELYRTHPEVAVALAAHLGGTQAQLDHLRLRQVIPTDINIGTDDALAKAQMDTMAYASIVQPLQGGMKSYWAPAESMGKELVSRKVTHANSAQKTEAMNTAMNTSVVE